MDDWFRTLDAATTKAVGEGFIYLSCRFMEPRRRLVLYFCHPDGRRFQRTLVLPIDERFTRDGRPLTISEIIDLKVLRDPLLARAGSRARSATRS
jgi:hypothetical protein